ncbi:hypothetical protein Tco_0475716 [Tanacetum coccineum]
MGLCFSNNVPFAPKLRLLQPQRDTCKGRHCQMCELGNGEGTVRVYGEVEKKLISRGFESVVGDGHYVRVKISRHLSFRAPLVD